MTGAEEGDLHCVLNEVVLSGTQEKGGEATKRKLQASDAF